MSAKEKAGDLLAASRRPVVLTGAGFSAESGVPVFRGPGGLWTKYGEFTSQATLSLRGPAGAVLERLLQLVLEAEETAT